MPDAVRSDPPGTTTWSTGASVAVHTPRDCLMEALLPLTAAPPIAVRRPAVARSACVPISPPPSRWDPQLRNVLRLSNDTSARRWSRFTCLWFIVTTDFNTAPGLREFCYVRRRRALFRPPETPRSRTTLGGRCATQSPMASRWCCHRLRRWFRGRLARTPLSLAREHYHQPRDGRMCPLQPCVRVTPHHN